MKKNWKNSKLGEFSKVIAGQSPKGEYYNNLGKGIPFYQGKKEFTDKYLGSPTTWTTSITKEAFEGDILMSVRAPVGPINVSTQNICIGRGLAAIRVSEKLIRDYLFYYLSHIKDKISGNSGAVFDSINKTQIENIQIPLPPLPEQQRIVDILDQSLAAIDQAIENTEKNLENLNKLFVQFQKLIFTNSQNGLKKLKISDVCESLHQGLNTAGMKIQFFSTGYPIIQTVNIDNNQINLEKNIKFMNFDDWNKYKDKYRPKFGDVFFTNIGTIGKTAVVTEEKDYLIHWNIFKLRPITNKIIPFYLKYTLDYLTESGFFRGLQKGGTVEFVTKKMISNVEILIPEIEIQINICKKLDNLNIKFNMIKKNYLEKIEKLQELKQSILHKAFNGELT